MSMVSSSIAKHREVLGKHLDDPTPSIDFLTLGSFGIVLLLSVANAIKPFTAVRYDFL